jgi:hypothetical protein
MPFFRKREWTDLFNGINPVRAGPEYFSQTCTGATGMI